MLSRAPFRRIGADRGKDSRPLSIGQVLCGERVKLRVERQEWRAERCGGCRRTKRRSQNPHPENRRVRHPPSIARSVAHPPCRLASDEEKFKTRTLKPAGLRHPKSSHRVKGAPPARYNSRILRYSSSSPLSRSGSAAPSTFLRSHS
jgi:hypothetical protein